MTNAFARAALSLLTFVAGCSAASDPAPVGTADLPTRSGPPPAARPADDLDAPGPIALTTVVSARWKVPLGGLVNLEAPKARAAGLKNEATPIVLAVHVIDHPKRGLFVVDTGVTERWRTEPGAGVASAGVRLLVSGIAAETSLASIVATHGRGRPLAGVFFTHLHIDHVLGLPEIPISTPLFAGPGERELAGAEALLLGRTMDTFFAGRTLHAFDYAKAEPLGPIAEAIDVFGDRSLFALHTPGHTAGSTAYLVRTTKGPVLLTGDCSHTRWGWDNEVEPGLFSADRPTNLASLRALRALAAQHPTMPVIVGHETDGIGTGVGVP